MSKVRTARTEETTVQPRGDRFLTGRRSPLKHACSNIPTEADLVLRVIPPQAVSVFCLVLSTAFQERIPSVGSRPNDVTHLNIKTHLKSFAFEVIRPKAFSVVMLFVVFSIWRSGSPTATTGKKSSQKWEQYTPGYYSFFSPLFETLHNALSPCVCFCLLL